MAEETIQLTKKALHRLKVVEAVVEKRLKQGVAAKQLADTNNHRILELDLGAGTIRTWTLRDR